jgi:penicillin-binding protein 2
MRKTIDTNLKLKLLLGPIIGAFVVLVLRLAHLQIVQGNYYQALADRNRYFRQEIPAERGIILDRYQQPLVKNKKFYFLTDDEVLHSQRTPIDSQEALRLMAQNPNSITYELRRWYLHPWSLSHVIGYTSPADKQTLLADSQLKVNDWVGKIGLEKEYDAILRGKDGYRLFEVDTLGRKQRLVQEEPAKPGQNIQTNLDPYLSTIAYEALSQYKGAVVVLDADLSQVLALVSKPAFNANDLSYALTDQNLEQQRQLNVQRYFTDENKVFFNRAISGTYPPGSVFKLVTAAAGLETGAIDQSTTVLDEGVLKVGDYEYANWYYTQRGGTDGEIALVRAITRSNDIYFYKAAEWTGPDEIAKQARDFGFGQQTGIELQGEAAGLVPDPAWKEKTFGERWFLGNTYHFGIGQGDMLVTPLQAAQLVQSLVNHGELCHPRLLKTETTDHCQNLGLSENTLDLILQGMVGACSPGGTGYPLLKFNQNLQESGGGFGQIEAGGVGCKTGTSEFGPEDEKGFRKTHGWFVAATQVETDQVIQSLRTRLQQIESGQYSDPYLTQEQLQTWLENIEQHGFPQTLAVAVLVESDKDEPFKEGSIQAAPIVETLFDYLK